MKVIAGIILSEHDCKVCGLRLSAHELPDFARCLRRLEKVEEGRPAVTLQKLGGANG